MAHGYQIKNQNALHFLTLTTVGWIDIFAYKRYREIIVDSLNFCIKNKGLVLHAWVIMSNHVHILISTLPGSPLLNVILQNHKKFTAVQSNKLLNRTGKFWEEESFDTLIRNNDHYYNCVNYIIQNPVKAGLVKEWHAWEWTYLHPELKKEFGTPVPNKSEDTF